MIDYSEIERTLVEAEANYDTSFSSVGKLSPLYSALIYKMLCHKPLTANAIAIDTQGESEFMQTINGKNNMQAWAIMDELMDTLQVLYPRAYDSVMRKLSKMESIKAE